MKKKYKKLFWVFLAVVIIIYVASNILFAVFGKAMVCGLVEKNLKLKTSLKSVTFGLPLSINLSDLEIEGLVKADYIVVSPSILGFLAGKIVLNSLKIVRPEITLEKGVDGKLNLPQFEQGGKQPPILLAGLKVREGRFVFKDRQIDPAGYDIALNDINLDISKVVFPPTSLLTRFNLSVFLVDTKNSRRGEVTASGWVDFGPKNMDGKFRLSDVDATYLAPYYQKVISIKKLLSAKLNFTADMKAQDNNLAVKCHTEFSDLTYKKDPAGEGSKLSFDLLPNAMDLFSNEAGKITFDFIINTKLDSPRLDLISLKGTVVQAAAQNITGQPADKMIEKVKDAAKQFKEIGESFKDAFKKKE